MSAEAGSFVIWLHGLGDSGPANEPIQNLFTASEFRDTRWSFPTAHSNPVTCNNGRVMPSWFDIHKFPVTGEKWQPNRSARFTWFRKIVNFRMTAKSESSPEVTTGLLDSVKRVHALIDATVASGIDPRRIFVCGLSQGGALTVASVLLYPQTLGGAAVFSGWIPSNASLIKQVTPEANKTPMLWCHGTDDSLILFDAGKAGQHFLKKAGINCEFKAYPGLKHELRDEELLYLGSWIKSHLGSSS
ncbi:unnamed protein product [Rhodiola kirilowii]